MPAWKYPQVDLNDLPPKTDEVDLLNELGDQGCELVGIMDNQVAYLKRRAGMTPMNNLHHERTTMSQDSIAATVDRAADAIVALINSKSSSPSKEEIKTIIAGRAGIAGKITITQLVQEVADLYALNKEMEAIALAAAKRALRAVESAKDETTPDPKAQGIEQHLGVQRDCEAVAKMAIDRAFQLDESIMHLEPQSTDETLSLALSFSCELDKFFDNLEEADRGSTPILSRAVDAIIRGLMRHAGPSSPLHWIHTTGARTWDDAIALNRKNVKDMGYELDP
jgi:hypothetical protein